MGLGLEPPAIPPAAADPHWHGWYDDVLASLRTITPRIADPLASQWTRGVARAVKYLQRIDVDGRQFVDSSSTRSPTPSEPATSRSPPPAQLSTPLFATAASTTASTWR